MTLLLENEMESQTKFKRQPDKMHNSLMKANKLFLTGELYLLVETHQDNTTFILGQVTHAKKFTVVDLRKISWTFPCKSMSVSCRRFFPYWIKRSSEIFQLFSNSGKSVSGWWPSFITLAQYGLSVHSRCR